MTRIFKDRRQAGRAGQWLKPPCQQLLATKHKPQLDCSLTNN